MRGMGWGEERGLKENTSKEIATQHIKLTLWAHLYLEHPEKPMNQCYSFEIQHSHQTLHLLSN